MASNDPFRPLLSLANQKTLLVSEKLAEKNAKLSESPVLADAKAAQSRLLRTDAGPGLLDIAQSSIRQGNETLFDAAHGATRTAEEIQSIGDATAGVDEETRNRLVTQPQQEVIESLAAGNYLDALIGGVKAAPGTLADSANVVPEIAAGAALTIAGGSGLPVLANRARKIFGGAEKIQESVKKTKKVQSRAQLIKEAAKTLPKTAGQMSVVTADITQRQIADFEQKHGERPSAERIASMYAINLATMTAEGGIIKSLFVPEFKKEFVKEAKAVVANLKNGSNLVSIGARIGNGAKKVLAAGGAEAAQEYVQTWADIVNVGIGPNDNLLKGLKRELGDKDNRLQSLGGAFLGFGAGGVARGVIAAPGVAAGTAIDTTKGVAKTGVKLTGAAVKTTGKVIKGVADKAAFKVLSQEERDVILSEHGSRKELVDTKVKEMESIVDKIKSATTIKEIEEGAFSGPKVSKNTLETLAAVVGKANKELDLSADEKLKRRNVERLKAQVIRAYRGDIALLKTELAATTGANIAKQSAKNIQSKSVAAAKATVDAVSPGVKAVIENVKQFGDETVAAVKELRSGTALGMIDLATNAGKAEIKTIVEAGKSLSQDDLKRATNVINKINPVIGRQLDQLVKSKDKALKRAGSKVDKIINDETLNPIVRDVAKRAVVAAGEIAAISSAVNATVAGKFDDLISLKDTELAVAAIEKSADFKAQINGAMTKENLETVKRKLAAARVRLEGEAVTIKDKVVQGVKDVVKKSSPVVKKAAETVTKAVKEATAPTIKISSTFRAVVKAVGDTIKDPKQAQPLVAGAGDFIKQMKKFGIESRSEFEAFIREFPEMQNNIEFFKKLDEAYPSDISAQEVFDNVKTKAVETLDQIKEAYNNMNPPECKV